MAISACCRAICPGMGGIVEFRAGQAGAAHHKRMRQELLDDWKRFACNAQIYLDTRMVGFKT